MPPTPSLPLERPFLHLHLHHRHGLSAADLARAFSLPHREAEDILHRAERKNNRFYARLLQALCESRR